MCAGSRRHRGPPLVPPRQRENRPVPVDRPRARRRPPPGRARRCCSTANRRPRREGRPPGFQRLQGRIHLTRKPTSQRSESRAAGGPDPVRHPARRRRGLRGLPLTERRARLEARFASRVSETHAAERAGRRRRTAMHGARRNERLGRADRQGRRARTNRASAARPGASSRSCSQQEFVVGGWTEPRQTRQHFGALLLGVYRSARLLRRAQTDLVGHTGTGFNRGSWRGS